MRDELNQQGVVWATTIMGFLVSLASAPTGGPEDLWDNSRFVMTCVAGSLAGAVLIMALPHNKMTARKMACEVFFSGLTGLLFAPALIEYFNVTKTTTWVLPASAIVAMVSLGTLRAVVPAIRVVFGEWLVRKVASFLGLQPPSRQPPTEKLGE